MGTKQLEGATVDHFRRDGKQRLKAISRRCHEFSQCHFLDHKNLEHITLQPWLVQVEEQQAQRKENLKNRGPHGPCSLPNLVVTFQW